MQLDSDNLLLPIVEKHYREIDKVEAEYRRIRFEAKVRLAQAIERAKDEGGHSIANIADYLGISRQAVNQYLVDVYGVRYQERSDAAKLGHIHATTREKTTKSNQAS